ncbi:hypothetical protein SAMN05216244_4115 [Sediminibacillus halophilus]|uniref:Uncharacterized protein n=1 Tax=Sediminibacillus halophilus TaxID=482461 RepID=A0A1G9YAD5_9BACI|nr:hypothetical protein SAMN05216244_4115 [Sediminibacillus halophilus]
MCDLSEENLLDCKKMAEVHHSFQRKFSKDKQGEWNIEEKAVCFSVELYTRIQNRMDAGLKKSRTSFPFEKIETIEKHLRFCDTTKMERVVMDFCQSHLSNSVKQ